MGRFLAGQGFRGKVYGPIGQSDGNRGPRKVKGKEEGEREMGIFCPVVVSHCFAFPGSSQRQAGWYNG